MRLRKSEKEQILQQNLSVQQTPSTLTIYTKSFEYVLLQLEVVHVGDKTLYRSRNKRKYKLYNTWPQAFLALQPLTADCVLACHEWLTKEAAKERETASSTPTLRLIG